MQYLHGIMHKRCLDILLLKRLVHIGHCSAEAVNPLHCGTQVCTPTSAQAQGFKESPTCCATQALGLQLVPLCTEEA